MTDVLETPTDHSPLAVDLDPINHGLSLIVADRGHVWVGSVTEDQSTYWITIEGARAVRRWGTAEGLNELATKGPRPIRGWTRRRRSKSRGAR